MNGYVIRECMAHVDVSSFGMIRRHKGSFVMSSQFTSLPYLCGAMGPASSLCTYLFLTLTWHFVLCLSLNWAIPLFISLIFLAILYDLG